VDTAAVAATAIVHPPKLVKEEPIGAGGCMVMNVSVFASLSADSSTCRESSSGSVAGRMRGALADIVVMRWGYVLTVESQVVWIGEDILEELWFILLYSELRLAYMRTSNEVQLDFEVDSDYYSSTIRLPRLSVHFRGDRKLTLIVRFSTRIEKNVEIN
jgi:hypothetical protein